jgi:hypothetical protein
MVAKHEKYLKQLLLLQMQHEHDSVNDEKYYQHKLQGELLCEH